MSLRILYLSLLLSLVCPVIDLSVCHATSSEQEFFPFLAEIISEKVNVRAGQNTNFEKLCQLDKGDQVIVVDVSYSWYKIKLPSDAAAFISEKYVRLHANQTGEITGHRVNIRAGAGTQYSIIGQLSLGTKLTIVGKKDGWYKIEPVDDLFGWVFKDLIQFKSKDISTYVRKKVEDAQEKISLEDRKSDPTAVLAEDSQEKIVEQKFVSMRGTLQSTKVQPNENIFYRIVTEDDSVYLIEGMKDLLSDLVGYTVKVEGEVKDSVSSPKSHPVINVSKIQLIY